MSFVPAPDVCRVAQTFVRDGLEAINVFHVLYGTGDHASQHADITALFHDAFLGDNGFMSSQWAMTQVEARDVSVEGGPVFVQVISPATAGGAGAEASPNQVAATVTWLTGLAGKSQRGRSYIVGLPEGNVHGNVMDTGLQTLIGAYVTNLFASTTTGGHPMQVVSYFHNKLPRTVAQVTPIATHRVNLQLATQRRRLTAP